MSERAESTADFDPRVGQCSVCERSAVQSSARGSRFWRCLRADEDEGFRRYPPLPVTNCPGYSPRARGAPR